MDIVVSAVPDRKAREFSNMLRIRTFRSFISTTSLILHPPRSTLIFPRNRYLISRTMTSSSPTELIAKLPAPVQALVQNASSHLVGNAAFGNSESDSKEVLEWLEIVSTLDAQAQLTVRPDRRVEEHYRLLVPSNK